MEKIKNKMKRLYEIKRCFVKRKGGLMLHDVETNLPSVPIKYEKVLKDKQIKYRYVQVERNKGVEIFCQYWDDDAFNEIEQELPTYIFSERKYTYIGNKKGKVPTKKSIMAALELKKNVVEPAINEEREKKCIEAIKNEIQGRNAYYTQKGLFRGAPMEGKHGNYYIFINLKCDGKESSDIIIFDLDKIYNERVVLEIPESRLEKVLGEENIYANYWIETLGLKEIEVNPV